MHLAAARRHPGDRDVRTDERAGDLSPIPNPDPRMPNPESRTTILTHPVWCRPCMLRECPLDHRCMRGIGSRRSSRRLEAVCETRSLSRSRRNADRRRRLSRPPRSDGVVPVDRRCDPRPQSCRPRRRGHHEPVGDRERALHGSVRRGDASPSQRPARGRRRAHRRVLLLSAPPDGGVEAYVAPCDCRKPASGMVDRAVRDLDLDPARSFVVGDKWLDVGLARAVGARGILVRTGTGAAEEARPHARRQRRRDRGQSGWRRELDFAESPIRSDLEV